MADMINNLYNRGVCSSPGQACEEKIEIPDRGTLCAGLGKPQSLGPVGRQLTGSLCLSGRRKQSRVRLSEPRSQWQDTQLLCEEEQQRVVK